MTFELGPNIKIWLSKSYFDIRTRAKCDILTFEILYWHSNWDRISNFVIRSPILTFQLGPDIILWHSECFFGILIGTEYRILTFEILFWHSNYGNMAVLLTCTCKNKEDPIKTERARVVTRCSPILALWELSVAMEIRVPIRCGPKPNAAFPSPLWC